MTPLKSIILYLVDNAEQLSKDKFSGVHDVDDTRYTVHEDSFVPRVLMKTCTNNIIKKTVYSIIDDNVVDIVRFDALTGWLTIWKAK